MGKKINILSLDGGGIRGVIPAVVMAYVEEKIIEITGNPQARIADVFDMIVGTSTGGILSCLYLTPDNSGIYSTKYSAQDAVRFYDEKGYHIFNASKKNSLMGLRQLFNATRYRARNLEEIFEAEFGDLKMAELKKHCLVTTYDIKAKQAHFFCNKEKEHKKRDFYVRDVVRSTSAAPTYFSPAKIRNLATNEEMINIDGGVFANNPTMCAYAEVRNTVFEQASYPTAKDMYILSVGTGAGQFDLHRPGKSNTWGVLNWAKSMPDIMMDAAVDTVNFQIKRMFGSLRDDGKYHYKRIDVPFDKRKKIGYSNNMANASADNILKLKIAAEAALEEALEARSDAYELDLFIEKLIDPGEEKTGLVS